MKHSTELEQCEKLVREMQEMRGESEEVAERERG